MSNNQLQVFSNEQFGSIRIIERNGEPWFVAADVCRALEISNNRDAISRIDEDEKDVALTDTLRGKQNMTIVNEPGLYALVIGSRKPEAKLFKRWITHEVIPSIRKHGAYMTPETIEKTLTDPDFIIRLATQLKDEQAKRVALEAKVEADAPKVLFADSVAASKQSILIGELAKLLRQNGVNIGQNRLFAKLREEGYLGTKGEYYNIPTQRAMDMKLFEIKKRAITSPDGRNIVSTTTKVTGKGQCYFVNRFLRSQDLRADNI